MLLEFDLILVYFIFTKIELMLFSLSSVWFCFFAFHFVTFVERDQLALDSM